MPAQAMPQRDKSVMRDGITFEMKSYVFLPEKVERWTGTYFGSLQPSKPSSKI
jgi:hypothetical protein